MLFVCQGVTASISGICKSVCSGPMQNDCERWVFSKLNLSLRQREKKKQTTGK